MFLVRRLKEKYTGVKFTMIGLLAAFSKQRNQQQHLRDIPDEIILKIFSYLSIQDLGKWTKMSKRFRNICWDQSLPYGEMTEKQNKERIPEFRQLLRDVKNPKISMYPAITCAIYKHLEWPPQPEGKRFEKSERFHPVFCCHIRRKPRPDFSLF